VGPGPLLWAGVDGGGRLWWALVVGCGRSPLFVSGRLRFGPVVVAGRWSVAVGVGRRVVVVVGGVDGLWLGWWIKEMKRCHKL
jgi:hypothetical protein